jgi:hypothetical protein
MLKPTHARSDLEKKEHELFVEKGEAYRASNALVV